LDALLIYTNKLDSIDKDDDESIIKCLLKSQFTEKTKLEDQQIEEILKYKLRHDLFQRLIDSKPTFPVVNADFSKIDPQIHFKTNFNKMRQDLINKWVDSNYKLTKDQLLNNINDPQYINSFISKKTTTKKH
jgi:hypothetical protein